MNIWMMPFTDDAGFRNDVPGLNFSKMTFCSIQKKNIIQQEYLLTIFVRWLCIKIRGGSTNSSGGGGGSGQEFFEGVV